MKNRSSIIQGSVALLCLIAGAAGCKHTIAVEPIEVKPIHMTLDINLKVDRELDEFFDEVEDAPTTAPAGGDEQAATQPASTGVQGGPS